MTPPDFERHEPDHEQSQEYTIFDILNEKIDLTRVYAKLPYRTTTSGQENPARKEVDSVSDAIRRVIQDIENADAAKDEYSPILSEYAPMQLDQSLSGHRAVHNEILLTLTQEGLLHPRYDKSIEVENTDERGKVTGLVQYHRTRLTPVTVNGPAGDRYEWMIRSSRIPDQPDRLVLRRVNPTVAPKQ